jgi:hypothetical protein
MIDDKFIDKVDIDDYEVLTPNGWKNFDGIYKTIPYQVYEIQFTNNNSIKCADNHIFMSDNNEIFAKNLSIGDMIDGKKGKTEIKNIIVLSEYENMYDLSNVDGSVYYTNDVASHNTTVISIYALWFAIFNADKTIGIVSNKQSSAIDILKRLKKTYEELPVWLKPGVIEWSKTFVTFDNGTQIMVSATSEDAFRGRTLNILFCDEYAFVPKNIADAFWAANYPTISSSVDAKIIIISTPNGMFNQFHTIYSHAEREENEFIHLKFDWRANPERDEAWATSQRKNLGNKKFTQEHLCVSGDTLIKVYDEVDKVEIVLKIKDLYNLL